MNKTKFGTNVDTLFAKSGGVSFRSLATANTLDRLAAAKSQLEQLHDAERKKKLGTDKLEWTRETSRTPIDLDKLNQPLPYAGRLERARSEELRQRFNLPNGLVLESKGESKKPYFESIGSKGESIFEVKFCQCNAGKVRW